MFYELLGLTESGAQQSWSGIERWWLDHPSMPNCFTGLSPHAPYSVRKSIIEKLDGTTSLPSAIHLAESDGELELLRSHTGPFVGFLKELGVWDSNGLVADPLEVVRL